MKSQLEALFRNSLVDLGFQPKTIPIARPENIAFGEYTTSVAFILGKEQKQNPIELAQKIIEHIQAKKNEAKSTPEYELLQAIESISIAGPGFINIKLVSNAFISQLRRVLNDKEAFGTMQSNKQRIIIEYTDPNPFKELHIGHLYSNAVGESLARLYESQGWDVRRVCYQGDVGLHVAKAIWGMKKKLAEEQRELTEIEQKSVEERAKWLGEAYVLGANVSEDDVQAQEEMKQINILAFISAQTLSKERGASVSIKYEPLLANLAKTSGSTTTYAIEEITNLYLKGRSWSLEYFEKQYKKLGTQFDDYYFESMVAELGYAIVQEHLADGTFEQSDGAVVYKGEKKGLHTRVFINKLGLPTYEAKELGLAPKKYEDWPYDTSIIVTGKEIVEYFKVLLAALGDVQPELAQKTKHVAHGMVRLPEGKMSSRKGNVLTAEWLMEEVSVSISSLIDKNTSTYTIDDQNDIVQKATIAAIKYSLLKVALPSDIAFDFTRSVSFDGDSGPYLLYTYARAKSVLNKSTPGVVGINRENGPFHPEEHELARLILYYPEIVTESAENLSPSTIVRYLIDLAQSFNLLYAKHKILDDELRMLLTRATAQVLNNGLWLLGIETVEKM